MDNPTTNNPTNGVRYAEQNSARLRLKTDAEGKVRFRGFKGRYEIRPVRPMGTVEPSSNPAPETGVWISAKDLTFEGQAVEFETEGPFDRLPASAKGTVPARVWELSKHAAGMNVRFVAESTGEVRVRYTALLAQKLHRLYSRSLSPGLLEDAVFILDLWRRMERIHF